MLEVGCNHRVEQQTAGSPRGTSAHLPVLAQQLPPVTTNSPRTATTINIIITINATTYGRPRRSARDVQQLLRSIPCCTAVTVHLHSAGCMQPSQQHCRISSHKIIIANFGRFWPFQFLGAPPPKNVGLPKFSYLQVEKFREVIPSGTKVISQNVESEFSLIFGFPLLKIVGGPRLHLCWQAFVVLKFEAAAPARNINELN